MPVRVAEYLVDRREAFEIVCDVEFPGHPHAAGDLHAVVDDERRLVADVRLRHVGQPDGVVVAESIALGEISVALRFPVWPFQSVVPLAFGLAGFITVPIAVWNFVRTDGGSSTDDAGYYSLLIPITIPATIIFVYLNWLSVSFFKTA